MCAFSPPPWLSLVCLKRLLQPPQCLQRLRPPMQSLDLSAPLDALSCEHCVAVVQSPSWVTHIELWREEGGKQEAVEGGGGKNGG